MVLVSCSQSSLAAQDGLFLDVFKSIYNKRWCRTREATKKSFNQLKSEIKEADTDKCKFTSNRQLECSLKAVLPRKGVRNSRPAFWEC